MLHTKFQDLESFFKFFFYHIWTCDLDHLSILSFSLTMDTPHALFVSNERAVLEKLFENNGHIHEYSLGAGVQFFLQTQIFIQFGHLL